MNKMIVAGLIIILGAVIPLFSKDRADRANGADGEVTAFPEVNHPYQFYVDGGKIYINEGDTITIYSLKEHRLLKRFGRKGDGPKEFRLDRGNSEVQLYLHEDSLQVNSVTRISYFSRTGEFMRVLTTLEGDYLQAVGDGYAGWRRVYEDNVRYDLVNLYDAKLKKVKEMFRRANGIQPQAKKINPLTWFIDIYQCYKGRIYINGVDGNIYVFDAGGNKLYTITLQEKRIKLTDTDREGITKYYKEEDHYWKTVWHQVKTWITFPEYYPVIASFQVVDDRIYVETFNRKNGKKQFLVLDLEGKVLNRVFLPLAREAFFTTYPFTIKNNRLYQMIENQDTEEWELHTHKIETGKGEKAVVPTQ